MNQIPARPLTTDRPWALMMLVFGIAAQIICTFAYPNQRWSVPLGLAFMAMCCVAIVLRSMPVRSAESWRWKLVALGLFFWGLMFLTILYQDSFLGSREVLSSILGSIKQLCFIVAIIPSSSRENDRAFRIFDFIQAALFVIALTILIWGSVTDVTLSVNYNYVNIIYVFLSAIGIISCLSQKHFLQKKFIFNVVFLQIGHGASVLLTRLIGSVYDLPYGSWIWTMGSIVILIFGIRTTRLIAFKYEPLDTRMEDTGPTYRRHLPPIFLTALLMILAFDIALQNAVLGAALGILGFVNYASRTTLLLDRYLVARDRLIATEQQHSRLLIDMIHEVRAPLGSIVLNASMLQRSADLPDQQARWVEQIGAGGTRVTTMLNDVLDIERIDAGLVSPKLTECDILPIIDAAAGIVASQAAAADITIAVEGGIGARARTDRTLLDRVLINLLTNAMRFTAQGGHITIAISEDGDGMIVIRVIDDGLGIAPDILATLFDRFSHTAPPLRGQRGSGLGLSICRGLMTLMGGDITIMSRPDEGTTATVRVPRAGPTEA